MQDNSVKGRIFDIQRYSIHDGNGIRTIVFLKGCVLRCKWCCNPESQEYSIQKMMVAGKEKIIGQDITVEEVLQTVERDRNYYRRSRGGITLSGGESLCQPEFALALLRESKNRGLHTAMESMGCADYSIIESILPYLDQYLLDIKHMNSAKHEQFTGKRNELMLENAKKIATANLSELIIRIPVVPTFNATSSEIADIARFAASLNNVKGLHLLPYHRLGQDKYTGLGRNYELDGMVPPANELMQELLSVAKINVGDKIPCQIGG